MPFYVSDEGCHAHLFIMNLLQSAVKFMQHRLAVKRCVCGWPYSNSLFSMELHDVMGAGCISGLIV